MQRHQLIAFVLVLSALLAQAAPAGAQPPASPPHAAVVPGQAELEAALAFQGKGQFAEAEPLLRKVVEMRRAALGDRNAETAAAYDALAQLLQSLSRYDEAKTLFDTVIGIRQNVLGPQHPVTAMSYMRAGCAAVVRKSESGSYRSFVKDGLDILIGDPDHPKSTGIGSHPELAGCLDILGFYRQARIVDSATLEVDRRSFGENDPRLATDYLNLAIIMRRLGGYAEADRLFAKALVIYRAAGGEKDPRTAKTYEAMGVSLTDQGRYAEAEQYYRKALDIRIALFGDRHLDTAESYNDIAVNLLQQARLAEADRYIRKAIDIYGAAFADQDPRTGQALLNLGQILVAMGRYREGQWMAYRALGVFEDYFGDEHPETARAAQIFTDIRFAGVEFEGAERYGDDFAWDQDDEIFKDTVLDYPYSLRISQASFGENSPQTARSYDALAAQLEKRSKRNEAERAARTALKIRQSVLGENHPETGMSYASVAALVAIGDYEEAAPLYRRAVAIRAAALGENHPSLAPLHQALGHELTFLHRYAEARVEEEQALTIALRNRAGETSFDANSPNQFGVITVDPFHQIHRGYLHETWMAASPGDAAAPLTPDTMRAVLAAQELLRSASSRAVQRAAGRTAARSGTLVELIREEQRLAAQSVSLDRQMIRALYSPYDAKAAALSAQREATDTRLAAIDASIDHDFPDYRTIISSQPVPLAQIQEKLGAEEGLLLLVLAGDEIYSFAISKTKAVWHRLTENAEEGFPTAKEEVLARIAHLRCQVDYDTCQTSTGDELPPPRLDTNGQPMMDGNEVVREQHSRHYDIAAAGALYRALIAPVADALDGVKRLYVTTSGQLGDMPLGALVVTPPAAGTPDDDPISLRHTDWLADHYAITYLPAVSGLLLRGSRPDAGSQTPFDGYGNPSLAPPVGDCTRTVPNLFSKSISADAPAANPGLIRTLCSLPQTGKELQSLAGELRARDGALHMGEGATERALYQDPMLARARVIAFATHGAFAGEGSEYGFSEPGLILTPPDRPQPLPDGAVDDGVLTASEAARLSLSAEWVILSACNTASTQGTEGSDGLSELARSFLYAGARALLASHWQVADDSAQLLTVETLRMWRADHGRTSRAAALGKAMQAMRAGKLGERLSPDARATMAHPADWAPFTVIANFDE